MARFVSEIMNSEVLVVMAEETARNAIARMRSFKVTSAPILDDEQRPIGVISLTDLTGAESTDRVIELMSSPARCLQQDTLIRDAAVVLSGESLHHTPVTDKHGKVVGMLSLIDVMRGLVGFPAKHPDSFPHVDPQTDLVWSDELVFSTENINGMAPSGPGVFALVYGGASIRDRVVWAEATDNIKTRLLEMVQSDPQPYPVALLMKSRHLWFRSALIVAPERRKLALERLRSLDWSLVP